jgi:hypothetical protein
MKGARRTNSGAALPQLRCRRRGKASPSRTDTTPFSPRLRRRSDGKAEAVPHGGRHSRGRQQNKYDGSSRRLNLNEYGTGIRAIG